MQRYRRISLATFLFLVCGLLQAIGWGQTNSDVRLYFFTMEGCSPCAQVAPLVKQFVEAGYPIQTIDARLQSNWAERFQVGSTPTFVMTVGQRETGRFTGILDSTALQKWFQDTLKSLPAAVPTSPDATFTNDPRNVPSPPTAIGSIALSASSEPSTESTIHQGTRLPGNEFERLAMGATVRLQVEDNEGISTATGTVIHSHSGESLVITCGHVFRESGNSGRISADVNWLTDSPVRVPGELITYDAGPNDVGLVLLHAGFEIPPVTLAVPNQVVESGNPIFSIGCDRNQPPTIRRSTIKGVAIYDRAKKYDIVGRPVLGRSGGGLFNDAGQLIGVCNAAVVDADEGVYSSIENLHSQISKSNLAHLFSSRDLMAVAQGDVGIKSPEPDPDPTVNDADLVPITRQNAEMARANTPVERVLELGGELEAIVILRSRSQTDQTRTVVIHQPSAELLSLIERAAADNGRSPDSDRLAQLRREMPQPSEPSRKRFEARAQSPN